MEEFVNSLGITEPGYMENNKYIIDIADSNEYSKIYSILDSNMNDGVLDIDESGTLVTDKITELLYTTDEYELKLIGNMKDDIYKLVVSERK